MHEKCSLIHSVSISQRCEEIVITDYVILSSDGYVYNNHLIVTCYWWWKFVLTFTKIILSIHLCFSVMFSIWIIELYTTNNIDGKIQKDATQYTVLTPNVFLYYNKCDIVFYDVFILIGTSPKSTLLEIDPKSWWQGVYNTESNFSLRKVKVGLD